MHGRLKIKTTAQQDAERKERRNEEMKIYQGAMKAIFTKRQENSHTEEDLKLLLKTTAAVLMSNPDISTLWNIRKEAVMTMLNGTENDPLLKKETELTVSCLAKNPKSYGAWHHRCWSMLKMKQANWDYEMMLCNKYLSLDERNFHCWDYRRFVVKHAKIQAQDELDYSMERININFSNYSAWHYRSKLLPFTHGNVNGTITEEKKREELDLVLNAAFTDPEDSSAWFYHKWLLGLCSPPKLSLASLRNGSLKIAFSRPVSKNEIQCDPQIELKSANGEDYDSLWTGSFPSAKVKICFKDDVIEPIENQVLVNDSLTDLDEVTAQVLETELNNCDELLELEPDSKWTLYTKVLLMKTLDPSKYHDAIIEGFEKLIEIDPKRRGYYNDQKSKILVEKELSKRNFDCLDLCNRNLSCVYFKEEMAFYDRIDLSGNKLSSLKNLMPYLTHCNQIVVDEAIGKNVQLPNLIMK